MQTIKLEVEDSKVDVILSIIRDLKDSVVKHYEVLGDTKETEEFINISQKSLEKIWDNQEDSEYDKFLKV